MGMPACAHKFCATTDNTAQAPPTHPSQAHALSVCFFWLWFMWRQSGERRCREECVFRAEKLPVGRENKQKVSLFRLFTAFCMLRSLKMSGRFQSGVGKTSVKAFNHRWCEKNGTKIGLSQQTIRAESVGENIPSKERFRVWGAGGVVPHFLA